MTVTVGNASRQTGFAKYDVAMIRILDNFARIGRYRRKMLTESNDKAASIAVIVAAERPSELADLERLHAVTQASRAEVYRRLDSANEAANPAFSNASKIKTLATMALAAAEAEQLTAQAAELDRTLVQVRREIAAAKSSSGVEAALRPMRRQAAQEIAISVRALYAGIARYNEISVAINQETGRPALLAPATFPIVDHILQKIAAGD